MINTQDKLKAQRKMRQALWLDIDKIGTVEGFTLTNRNTKSAGILSERRIAKCLTQLGIEYEHVGAVAGQTADWVFRTVKRWQDEGFPGGANFVRDTVITDGVKLTLYIDPTIDRLDY